MRRQSGVLAHITSLPSRFGIGDLGPAAFRFADWLQEAGQCLWQILPINPTDMGCQNSPYSSPSAFAGNPWMISPEFLCREGFLKPGDIEGLEAFPSRVDYAGVAACKEALLERAYQRVLSNACAAPEWSEFERANQLWLEDYALFVALKQAHQGAPWDQWPEGYRFRNATALKRFARDHRREIMKVKFVQYLFFRQWGALKRYCRDRGIALMGDIPIYVTFDSVDVWRHPRLFKLDEQRRPYVVAGVPPDYFSETGQRWGNPVYDWTALRKEGYTWWIDRLRLNMDRFDWVRIDHFRGLVNYWEIPAEEPTAVKGYWVDVPTGEFFEAIKTALLPTKEGKDRLPIIAEDLGIITPEVREVMRRQGFPGMKILLFAFGEDDNNPYLPHHYQEDCVVYTGTHDNNTVRGWFFHDSTEQERRHLRAYLGRDVNEEEIHWVFIEMALRSKAFLSILPLQDILGLGPEARMNTPGTVGQNWLWRCEADALRGDLAKRLKGLTREATRVGND